MSVLAPAPRTADADSEPLARLRSLADHALDPRAVCIHARRTHGAKSVDVEQHQMAIVLRGRKTLRCGAHSEHYAAGDLLAMAAGSRIDATNVPDPADGRYLTLALPVCPEVQQAARVLWPHAVDPDAPRLARVPAAALGTSPADLADAIEADDEAQARVAFLALLMHAVRRGCTGLLLPPVLTVAAQVRAQVAQSPGRDWASADIEATLAMSGATLRRRLAEEGTGLREQIAEARLAAALGLLYTTSLPVKTVAARVGYRSVDSFSRRFRERYGMAASDIGNAPVDASALSA